MTETDPGSDPTTSSNTPSSNTPSSSTPESESSDPACASGLPDLKGCPCNSEGATRACYTGPAGTQNMGACKDGKQTCISAGEFLVWDSCSGDVKPSAEVCSGTGDENCNGDVGCADSSCTGLAGCCKPGENRNCYDGPVGSSGVGACASGTQTCDANGAWQACTNQVVPSAEVGHCGDNVDNDCDGAKDCDDTDCASELACQPPICVANSTKPCYDGAPDTKDVGQCHAGTLTCAPDGHSWSTTCVGQVLPGNEAGKCSDGIDNDCDGLKDCTDPACNGDPACACVPNSTRSCYTGPVGTADVGQCKSGTQTCNSIGSAWGPCTGEVFPGIETGACSDNIDNDCDGKKDCADTNCTFATNCCVPTTSYDNSIYATSANYLWKINPTDWSETSVGQYLAGETMTDLAMTPNGNIYTVSSTSLYSVDKTTAKATKVMTLTGSLNNSLTFLPDNRLLAADASGTLKVIDPVAKTVTNIGSYSGGYGSSGDLVAVGNGTMFGISHLGAGGTNASTNNVLLTVDTSTGTATPIGPIGFGDVFGIAYYKSRVIAFTGAGKIIEINPATGAGTLLRTASHAYYGGTTSPLIPINGCQ